MTVAAVLDAANHRDSDQYKFVQLLDAGYYRDFQFKVMLIVIVARLIFAWWQRRSMPAPAYAAAHPATGHSFGGLSGMLAGTNAPPGGEPTIAESDYDAFERLLGDIQAAYSAKDLSALRAKVTPEMLSYFSEQLAGNASGGLFNRVTDVKLLQGAIWRMPGAKAIPIMRPWP